MRVLFLSTTTGYQLRSFGESAERLGIELVLASDRCHVLDDPWRDRAIPVRFFDPEGSTETVRAALADNPVSGVIAVGDRPAILAAWVAEALGLPGNPPAAATAAGNKRLMRRALAAARMKVPWVVDLPADADPADVSGKIGYPCVVKPLGLSAGRGVIRADTPAQFVYAVERIRTLLARPDLRALRTGLDDQLLVEGYLEGREFALEGVLTRGELRIFAVFEKPDPLEGPFFEETIYVTPSDLSAEIQHQMADEAQRACAALGLIHGPVHAECRVGPGGIFILEVAARPIGGLCSRVLRFRAGQEEASLEEVLLRHTIGEDISPYMREERAAGVMMIPIPKRGHYKGTIGEHAAAQVPDVDHVEITVREGQLLEPLPEGDCYLGFIFARAAERDAVISALREAHRRLSFDIDAELPIVR